MLRSAALSAGLAALSAVPAAAQDQFPGERPAVRQGPALRTLKGFVANHGQWSPEVLFYAKNQGIAATLLADGIVLQPLRDPEALGPVPPPITLRLPHACATVGEGLLPTQHHFILGSGTTSNVPGFERVAYRDVAPGIDIELRADATGFAYDLHVAPGAMLEDLTLGVEGVGALRTTGDATVLAMDTLAGPVEQRIGMAWEVDAATGAQSLVQSQFRVLPASGGVQHLGFAAPGRDPSRAFVLDPSLVFSTFIGGSSTEFLRRMTVGADGAAYMAAYTFGSPPPTSAWAYQSQNAGSNDVWIGKLSADGTTLEWATLLGGLAVDEPFGLGLESDGTVVVMGNTFSTDFPTTAGALQPFFAGGNDDLFLSRLAPDGSALVWSTYYGGDSSELAAALALFPNGDVLIAADPFTASPPATVGAFDASFDPVKQLVARISGDGTTLQWQTYFAASVRDILIDQESQVLLSGFSNGFLPVTDGVLKESFSSGDLGNGFVARLSDDGATLLWATYLGGDAHQDSVEALALDAAGAIYVAGNTSSRDFPVTPGAYDVVSGGNFVSKLLPQATGLVWSTFMTGCCGGGTSFFDLAVDSSGSVLIVGSSNQPNFPVTPDAFQAAYSGGSSDLHLTQLDALGEKLLYSTYFGGSGSDTAGRVGLDPAQDPVVAFYCGSSDLPTTSGAYDTSNAGGGDICVAKFDLELQPWQVQGGGLGGEKDIPNLSGSGTLVPGAETRISLRGLPPPSIAFLVAGLSVAGLPFKGGTLVPTPDLLVPVGNSGGGVDLIFSWPTTPPGVMLVAQAWLVDAGAPAGWSASNALALMSQ